LNPIDTAQGPMILAAVVDISERKDAEQRLRAAYAEKEARRAQCIAPHVMPARPPRRTCSCDDRRGMRRRYRRWCRSSFGAMYRAPPR
jgi:hypothetical protein